MNAIQVLDHQLAFTQFVLRNNTSEVTHEESLAQPSPGGNCMNWIVGHIIVARNQFLTVLGKETVWDEAMGARYRRGGEPILGDGDGVHRFERLVQDLELTYDRIRPALVALSDDRLAEKAALSPTNNPDETWGSLFSGLLFHEAYHSGQTGILRRVAGKDEGGLN